jgi:hypothetical protein
MIHDGTTEFYSEREVSYSCKGVEKFTTSFVLREPGMEHCKHAMRIKQMVMQIFREITAGSNKSDDPDISGEEVKPIEDNHEQNSEEAAKAFEAMFMMSEKVEVSDFLECFRAMACMRADKPIVMLDGEQTMTDSIWRSLSLNDGYKMATRWAAFFAMPSADGQKKSSNKPSASSGQAKVV